MSATLLMIVALVALLIGYLVYGRYVARKLGLDPSRATPAHTKQDGVDYVPAKAPVLMGHHFASIAGAAPILGPIYAAVFGWVPVLLWIIIGSIFLGGVHDFSSIVASVRHGGKTIGEVIEDHIGKSGKRLFLVFAWSVVVLVIATFANAVANVFVAEASTATASFLFIIVAVLFGLSVHRLKTSLWLSSAIGVAVLLGCIALGLRFPIDLPPGTWKIILFVYVFFAAVAPVWILLQPRDYLNSFLLYMILILGVVGIFAAKPEVSFPAFTAFHVEGKGYLFPILFVMVACGAISGFHSLVSAGTTAKQLDKETDAKVIGYGSMLIEGLLAVIALITAVTILQSDYAQKITTGGGGPIGIFSAGIGSFVSHLGIPEKAGMTFAALAISAFALTTLDTATRLGRFMFQEFFEGMPMQSVLSKNRYVGTVATIGVAAFLTFTRTQGALWPLFGAANQLLASLALLAITVWLAKSGRDNRFLKYPMYFMFCVTITALGFMVYNNFTSEPRNLTLVVFSLILLAVAITLVANAAKSLRSATRMA
ncbi:MAG: carbon starvation CstA family protein [Planctomycetota bacterium]|jgi:carbon starvation protein